MKILWGGALLSGVLLSLMIFCFDGMSRDVHSVWYYIITGIVFGVWTNFGIKRKRV